MVTLVVNGKPREIGEETDVAGFLQQLEIDRRTVAVAVNGEVVSRDLFATTRLHDGDSVEIVRMVGGG